MVRYPPSLNKLVEVFRKLPGVGLKSAERFAFHMLALPQPVVDEMLQGIEHAKKQLRSCSSCGCLMDAESCAFCNDRERHGRQLCLVAAARDVFILEATGEYRGLYHVLGGLLSPMEGYHPEHLFLANLQERIAQHAIQEVIIALDATLEGDATAFYLKRLLEPCGVALSRLAFGLPMGSSFEFVDGGTLARAFSGRSHF